MSEYNLNDDALAEIIRRLRILETTQPVGYTAVSRGALRILSNEGLIVMGSAKVDGWLVVTGTERVTGLLEVLGTLDVSGSLNVAGPLTVSGLARLLNTLSVEGGGKIKVGTSMTLDPSVASGAIVFGNGAQIFTDSSTIQVYKGNGVVQVSDSQAKLQFGGAAVVVDANGVRMSGLPTIEKSATPGGAAVPGTIWMNSSNQLFRVV